MADAQWFDLGPVEKFKGRPVMHVKARLPYVAHSRGWSAEDMDRNNEFVKNDAELHEGAAALAGRAVVMAQIVLAGTSTRRLRSSAEAAKLTERASLPHRTADRVGEDIRIRTSVDIAWRTSPFVA